MLNEFSRQEILVGKAAMEKLRQSRVAVFGVGGLGMSAVQLAYALGALRVLAVDIDDAKLALAQQFGALPVNAREGDAG
jgi:Zn-dependent alcohol dehydrogenase